MRTVTNYFLVNLSAADLLMSVLNCIFNFIYMLHSDWPFGSVYCTISNFMANVTIGASVFTLMAISFDRYIAIVRPLKPRMTKSEARNFIVFIWASSMLLALPCLLYSTTVSIRYKNNEIRRGCVLMWPDGETSISYREYVYNIVFFATTYLLPMLVMLVSYSLISCELWGSHSIGELTDRQANSIKSKRRVVRMFIVIVVIFMLCWLPQQGFFLYQYHNNQVLDTANIQHIYLGFYWLAMANAMVNPIIYYWMNARFRSYFREVVLQCRPGRCCFCCCFCCCSRSNNYLDSPHLTRRRCDSADQTSRSRSDVNGGPRCIVSAVPRRNNHLLVYSARGKVNNNRGCGASPQNNERPAMMKTDSFHLRDLTYKPPEDSHHTRKPLRAEKDWHYIQYLSDQKALRIRNEQTLNRSIRRVNGCPRSQQDSGGLMGKKMGPQSNVTEETTFVNQNNSQLQAAAAATGDAAAAEEDSSSSQCLPSISSSSRTPEGCRVLTPKINAVSVPRWNDSDGSGSNGADQLEPAKERENDHAECGLSDKIRTDQSENPLSLLSSLVKDSRDIPKNTVGNSADQASSPTRLDPGGENSSSSPGRNDTLSDGPVLVTFQEDYRQMKYLNGNLVHQAIEETLMAVKKQALTRDVRGTSTTNVVIKSPSGTSLHVTKELML